MTTDLTDIRARWERVEWHYGEDQEGEYIASAFLISAGRRILDLEEPKDFERELLSRVAAAPGDVQTLLAEIGAARSRLDDQAPTLAAAVESAYRQQQELIAAFRANERRLWEQIERLKADSAAWWQIVSDLHQLGCLDCSNNACDRARSALGADHPGAELLKRLETAEANAAASAVWQQAHADAWRLIGRCDMAFELIASADGLTTARKTAVRLRAEIAAAAKGDAHV